MTRARVGYVLKMFPRFSETFILSELLELERQGTEIEIFSLRAPVDARVHGDLARLRARIRYVPQATWSNAPALLRAHLRMAVTQPRMYVSAGWRALRRRGATWRHFLQAGWVAAGVQSAGIEHLHAHFASIATSVALQVHRISGTSYSFTAHAKDIFIDGVDSRDLRRKIDLARFAVTVSDYNLRYLGPLDERRALVRIYNGLDLEQFGFSETDVGKEENNNGDPPLILAIGRLIEKKGFADLISACGVLRDRGLDFRCRVIGSGELRADLAGRIDALGLASFVRLDGPMPREQLVELLPRASAFVAPCVVGSDGNRDGLPTVLVEAMARGVPVVATDVTGIPELVTDGQTGLIVPQHEPRAVADAIQRLLTDRGLAQRLTTSARAAVEARFDLRHNVAQLRSLLVDSAVAR